MCRMLVNLTINRTFIIKNLFMKHSFNLFKFVALKKPWKVRYLHLLNLNI